MKKVLSIITALGLTAALTLSTDQALAKQKQPTPFVTGPCTYTNVHTRYCPVEAHGQKLTRADVESMLTGEGAPVEILMQDNGATVHIGHGRNRKTTHLMVITPLALQRTSPVVMCGGVLVRVIDCPDHLVGTVS